MEPWMIEDLERGERERPQEQPRLELPLYSPEPPEPEQEPSDRGVVVIQIW